MNATSFELYRSELRCHILPTFGGARLGEITTEAVRSWPSALVRATSAISAAKCYRLLRAICATAVEDICSNATRAASKVPGVNAAENVRS